MRKTTCAFTGHRPKSFPWNYNEEDCGCILLKAALAEQINQLTERGVTDWLTGMALGADVWAAEIVLGLKKEKPALRLHCILPCEGQERKWSASERERYHSILRQADEIIYVSWAYYPDCMLKRNRFMVEQASILLAIYNGTQRSGTGATVRYAQKLEREIIIIDPISRDISHQCPSCI